MNGALATLFLLASLLSPALVSRRPDILGHAGAATIGTVTIAYGGREVLRGLGGGYYCCSQGFYATVGVVLVFAGWVALLPTLGIVEPPSPPNSPSDLDESDERDGPSESAGHPEAPEKS